MTDRLAPGDPAPDFTLDDQDGNPVRLAGLKGKPIVLYFYPKDDTPGCTTEACSFRDARADYEAAGATISATGRSPTRLARYPSARSEGSSTQWRSSTTIASGRSNERLVVSQ